MRKLDYDLWALLSLPLWHNLSLIIKIYMAKICTLIGILITNNKNYSQTLETLCNKLQFISIRANISLLGLNQSALFSDGYFSIKKGVWRSQISWLFLIHYELSEKQKKFFWFFTVFWGDLEGAGWFSPPPCTQATSRSPAPLGLNPWSNNRTPI